MRHVHKYAGVAVAIWFLVGCVGDKGVAPALRPAASTLGSITVTPRNAVMAVGDTLSITFMAATLDGASVTAFDSVKYLFQTISDTLRVRVSNTGLVTAVAASQPNSPVLVNVLVFKDGVAAADQAAIQITLTRIAGATLSIQPVPPDSAVLAWGNSKTLTPRIGNATTGQYVNGPSIRFEYSPQDSSALECYVPNISAPSTLAQTQLTLPLCGGKVFNGFLGMNQIHALRKGTAWVFANVNVYGVPLRDSVLFRLTNPLTALVYVGTNGLQAGGSAYFSDVVIAPGGTVQFYNNFPAALGLSVAYTIDHPEAALAATPPSQYGGQSGNVTSLTSTQNSSSRIFVTPGVYTVTATVSGGVPPFTGATTTGTITVQ
jgi:hypothetical protein